MTRATSHIRVSSLVALLRTCELSPFGMPTLFNLCITIKAWEWVLETTSSLHPCSTHPPPYHIRLSSKRTKWPEFSNCHPVDCVWDSLSGVGELYVIHSTIYVREGCEKYLTKMMPQNLKTTVSSGIPTLPNYIFGSKKQSHVSAARNRCETPPVS